MFNTCNASTNACTKETARDFLFACGLNTRSGILSAILFASACKQTFQTQSKIRLCLRSFNRSGGTLGRSSRTHVPASTRAKRDLSPEFCAGQFFRRRFKVVRAVEKELAIEFLNHAQDETSSRTMEALACPDEYWRDCRFIVLPSHELLIARSRQ